MFHRTLVRDDPRWMLCDPEYTLETGLFAQSLAFFARHYRVVSLADVVAAHRGERRLPPRALLISFDDGWADNVDHALPALRRAGLPAVMFVAADAVGASQPFFQECLISSWRRGALSLSRLGRAVADANGDAALALDAAAVEAAMQSAAQGGVPEVLRKLIAALECMPGPVRETVLAAHAETLDDGLRHMIDVEELSRLRAGAVEIGLHGKSHVAMTRAEDLDAELGGAMAALRAQLDLPGGDAVACRTMSFPHGAFDAAIAERARDAGYALLFTSVPVLNAVGDAPSWLLGRTGYETGTVVDAKGRFRPDHLAWYLFRRPVQRLQAADFRN